jgi:uncharacterized membrane protein YwzB
MARKKKNRFGRHLKSAILWVITFVFGAMAYSSMQSIMINQFAVGWKVYAMLVFALVMIIVLIAYNKYTTNETIAFKKK